MDQACAHNWFAKSAIEMACWDIQGARAFGKPVHELLGGPRQRTNDSQPILARCLRARPRSPASARARRCRLLDDQSQSRRPTLQRCRARTGGAPQAGPDVALVIDANGGWDADTSIAAVGALAECRLSLVEQPTPDGDYAALPAKCREITPPVMADDICFNLAHARELVRNQCCDVISVYPGKNGGIGKARAIAEYAAAQGLSATIGSNLEWDIASAAMGHLVVACGAINVERYPGDLLGPDYHEFSIARQPLDIRGPLLTVPDRPGLGIDVDWDAVRGNLCRS